MCVVFVKDLPNFLEPNPNTDRQSGKLRGILSSSTRERSEIGPSRHRSEIALTPCYVRGVTSSFFFFIPSTLVTTFPRIYLVELPRKYIPVSIPERTCLRATTRMESHGTTAAVSKSKGWGGNGANPTVKIGLPTITQQQGKENSEESTTSFLRVEHYKSTLDKRARNTRRANSRNSSWTAKTANSTTPWKQSNAKQKQH